MSASELRLHSQMWDKGMVRIDLRGALTAQTIESLEEEFERWFSMEAHSFVVLMQEIRQLSNAGAGMFVALVRQRPRHRRGRDRRPRKAHARR